MLEEDVRAVVSKRKEDKRVTSRTHESESRDKGQESYLDANKKLHRGS